MIQTTVESGVLETITNSIRNHIQSTCAIPEDVKVDILLKYVDELNVRIDVSVQGPNWPAKLVTSMEKVHIIKLEKALLKISEWLNKVQISMDCVAQYAVME